MGKDTYNKVIDLFNSPALLLAAAPLIIIASSRFAFALVTALAILWVYGISVVLLYFTRKFFPKKIFYTVFSLFLLSFITSFFYLLFELINPPLALELALVIFLIPVFCFASEINLRTENYPLGEALYTALFEAVLTAGFIVVFSLVREPLGYGVLSVPGGESGIIELFEIDESRNFPVQLVAGTSGALFLLGYIFLAVRLTKPKSERQEAQKEKPSKAAKKFKASTPSETSGEAP